MEPRRVLLVLFFIIVRSIYSEAQYDIQPVDALLIIDGVPSYLRIVNSTSLENIYSCILQSSQRVNSVIMATQVKGLRLDVGQTEESVSDIIRRLYASAGKRGQTLWKSPEDLTLFKSRLVRYLTKIYYNKKHSLNPEAYLNFKSQRRAASDHNNLTQQQLQRTLEWWRVEPQETASEISRPKSAMGNISQSKFSAPSTSQPTTVHYLGSLTDCSGFPATAKCNNTLNLESTFELTFPQKISSDLDQDPHSVTSDSFLTANSEAIRNANQKLTTSVETSTENSNFSLSMSAVVFDQNATTTKQSPSDIRNGVFKANQFVNSEPKAGSIFANSELKVEMGTAANEPARTIVEVLTTTDPSRTRWSELFPSNEAFTATNTTEVSTNSMLKAFPLRPFKPNRLTRMTKTPRQKELERAGKKILEKEPGKGGA